jgi:hypothetical protein
MLNKKVQISVILVISILNFTGCKKESSIELNKEEIISLNMYGLGSSSTEPFVDATYLPYFDISSYSNLKSVVLAVSNIKTFNDLGDVAGTGIWELYDITNGKIIENSMVSSDDIPENNYITSSNFISNFPKGKIKLGIRIASGGAYNVQCGNISLILSR